MQRKRPIGGSLAAATCGLLGALPSAPVAAQEVPGWELDSSLLYYGESDDRVTDASAMVTARRAFDEDHALNLAFTVDSLTGATPSGAAPAASVQTFTTPSSKKSYAVPAGENPLDDSFLDTRVALTASWQAPLGDSMRWSAGLSASTEYDYLHLGIDGRLERDFNRNNTTAYVGAAYSQDDIDPVGGTPLPLAPMREVGNLSSKAADDSKDLIDLLVGVTQVLSRRSLLEVSYSYGSSDGYLNDPYKFLSVVDPVTGTPVAGPAGSGLDLYLYENRPDARAKQSLFAEWRHAFDRDSMAVNVRLMTDDWGVDSETVEARYRWNINERNYLEPQVRWYSQSAADFYRTVLFDGDALPRYASADYRLADLDAWTVGAKFGHRTDHGEFSVRLAYYRQEADPSAGAAVGDLAAFDLVPPLDAVIAQFGYKFRL
jgi:hypothetical protein